MRNLLYGCILVILGIFLAIGYDWARENFVPTPSPLNRPNQANNRFSEIDHLRESALRKFADIPVYERQELRDSLRSAIASLDSWAGKIRNATPDLICVGEKHDDLTRAFLADQFFSRFLVDVLMLETTHEDLDILIKLIDSGSSRLSILEADMADIIRAARATNSEIFIYGIEESRDQRIARFKTGAGSREKSIVENFRTHFREGSTHAVLYGALHCLDEPNWFFGRIRAAEDASRIGSMMSINVINASESIETQAFVDFLQELGLPRPPFVIPHTSMLHAEVYAWFPQLTQSFRQYDSVVLF